MGRLDIVDRARDYVRETLRDHYPSHIGPDADARVRARFNIRLPREFMVPGNGRW
jgi:trimethylamine:corrinoid methyltransferase-like protein